MARITVYNMKIILSVMAFALRRPRRPRKALRPKTALLSENTVKVSDHVWAIMGWPNIGIVVGEKATLVVDTGLGRATAPRSREWQKNSRPTTSSI